MFLDYGVSDTAAFRNQAVTLQRQRLLDTETFRDDRRAFEELSDVFHETGRPDWDGHNALPVSADTMGNAYRFLEAIPFGVPSPSIGAEPDGALTAEWHQGSRKTLSVSIDEFGVLHYAALLGDSSQRGAEPFLGDLPEPILRLIRRVCAR